MNLEPRRDTSPPQAAASFPRESTRRSPMPDRRLASEAGSGGALFNTDLARTKKYSLQNPGVDRFEHLWRLRPGTLVRDHLGYRVQFTRAVEHASHSKSRQLPAVPESAVVQPST